MLSAGTIMNRAQQIAKCPEYTAQALDLLNAILDDLAETKGLASSRGLLTFNFNPGLLTEFGSGPYNLPVDYLRASESSGDGQMSVWWVLLGVPYPMVPCDLSEFDMQVQQAGLQSYPWLWATDVSTATQATSSRYKAVFSAALVQGSTSATVPPGLDIAVGDGISGEGIEPGTLVTSYASTTLGLSLGATTTLAAASVFTGFCPRVFVYPPPSGAYPVFCRYQRIMPPITDTTKYPWFPNEGYLIDELAGRLMEITDDSRTLEFLGDGQRVGRAGRRLRAYLEDANDKKNRPQTVELDRRIFGPSYRTLKNTKSVGWLVLLCVGLAGMLGTPFC